MPMSLECALRGTMDGWRDDLCQEGRLVVENVPASCRKNRPIHAFTAQNTGFLELPRLRGQLMAFAGVLMGESR